MVVVIGMVGLPAAGKSTFAKKLVNELNISHVNGDQIRDYLISSIKYFNGADYSHSNPLIKSVNNVVRPMSDRIVEELLSQGQSVIIDGYGKTKENRDSRRKLVEKFNAFIVIVYVKEEQEPILTRLKKRDEGNSTKWVENYSNKWLPEFSEPQPEECDLLLTCTQDNKEEILNELKKVLAQNK
ncbi:MAG: nucleoside monophosphate kinase [Candidatus Nanoarchaeia archaeon]